MYPKPVHLYYFEFIIHMLPFTAHVVLLTAHCSLLIAYKVASLMCPIRLPHTTVGY